MSGEKDREIERPFRLANLAIMLVGGGLALVFTYLQIKNAVGPLLKQSTSQALIRLALVILYCCWIFGLGVERAVQQKIVRVALHHGKIPNELIAGGVFFVVVATTLLFVSEEYEVLGLSAERASCWVALLLALLFVANIGLIFFNERWQKQAFSATEQQYTDDNIGREKLRLYANYTFGTWRYWRFGCMAAAIVLVNLACWTERGRDAAAVFFMVPLRFFENIPLEIIRPLVPGLAILLYVLTFEIWQWYMRLRTHALLHFLDVMRTRYKLERL